MYTYGRDKRLHASHARQDTAHLRQPTYIRTVQHIHQSQRTHQQLVASTGKTRPMLNRQNPLSPSMRGRFNRWEDELVSQPTELVSQKLDLYRAMNFSRATCPLLIRDQHTLRFKVGNFHHRINRSINYTFADVDPYPCISRLTNNRLKWRLKSKTIKPSSTNT